MWVTCFMNLKDNLFFPVFSVQFCSSYLQPEFPIVMLSFLLLHCDMIYLVLVSLLGGQQAHGQLIWAVGTWMVMPQDTPSWPVCAPSPSPSWWLPMKGSKDHLQIPRWNSALRALKAGVCTGGGVCYPPPVSPGQWKELQSLGDHIWTSETPVDPASVSAWSLRATEGLGHLEHLWA